MNVNEFVEFIFTEPKQWGLRGDPFLWDELREHFLTNELPESSEDFCDQVGATIKKVIGSDLKDDQHVFVERYAAGGMSSGYVCPEWWRETGFPLLAERFADYSHRSRMNIRKSRVQLESQRSQEERLRLVNPRNIHDEMELSEGESDVQ